MPFNQPGEPPNLGEGLAAPGVLDPTDRGVSASPSALHCKRPFHRKPQCDTIGDHLLNSDLGAKLMLYRLPEHDLQRSSLARDTWTAQLVISALVAAYDVLSLTTGRVGPRGMKAFWPEYQTEFGDLTARSEIGSAERRAPRRRPSSVQIARMEMALLGWRDAAGEHPAWLNGPLRSYDRPRMCLVASIMAKHCGMAEVEVCRRTGWALATFRRQKLAGAQMIADQLNRLQVKPW
jgi:hypothetical protein